MSISVVVSLPTSAWCEHDTKTITVSLYCLSGLSFRYITIDVRTLMSPVLTVSIFSMKFSSVFILPLTSSSRSRGLFGLAGHWFHHLCPYDRLFDTSLDTQRAIPPPASCRWCVCDIHISPNELILQITPGLLYYWYVAALGNRSWLIISKVWYALSPFSTLLFYWFATLPVPYVPLVWCRYVLLRL